MIEFPPDTSKRSLTVLAVVVACFAVLWPKIFYPMILSILFPSDNEEENQEEIRKMDFQSMLHPQMREAMGEARPLEKPVKDGNKAIFHPTVRYAAKPQSKGAGAMNLVIPVYTIAIIVFFIYSLLKTTCKRKQDSCNSVNIKQQTVTNYKCPDIDDILNKRKETLQERKTQRALEQYGKEKVLTALQTIILEMEDFKGNGNENNIHPDVNVVSEGLKSCHLISQSSEV